MFRYPNIGSRTEQKSILKGNAEFTPGVLIGAAVASLAIGIGLGLLVTWVIWPIEFKNAAPADLRSSLKDDYVRMISAAYELDGDLATAQQRIKSLGLANETKRFDDLIAAEKLKPGERLMQDALIHLGQALGLGLPYTAERPAPGAPTPMPVFVIATPMPNALIFRLVEHAQLTCVEEPEAAHLRIIVRDTAGKDLPNIGIEIRGEDISETIYTGLKPERGVGYADYEAAPGKYSVMILNAEAESVSDLLIGPTPANCRNDRGATPRGWKLIFQQR